MQGVGGLVVEQAPHVQGCCRSGPGSTPACGPLLRVTPSLSPPSHLSVLSIKGKMAQKISLKKNNNKNLNE